MKLSVKLAGLLIFSGLLLTIMGPSGYAAYDISPVVPSIASFILPGAGQLINNQPEKALTHFIIIIGIDTATYLLAGSWYRASWTTYRLGTALHLAWSGYSAYDAYQVATGHRGGIFGSSLELGSTEQPDTKLELASQPFSLAKTSGEFSVSAVSEDY